MDFCNRFTVPYLRLKFEIKNRGITLTTRLLHAHVYNNFTLKEGHQRYFEQFLTLFHNFTQFWFTSPSSIRLSAIFDMVCNSFNSPNNSHTFLIIVNSNRTATSLLYFDASFYWRKRTKCNLSISSSLAIVELHVSLSISLSLIEIRNHRQTHV